MEQLVNEGVAVSLALIPFVMTVVQLLKNSEVNNRWLPHLSLLAGVLLGVGFAIGLDESLLVYGVGGFISGASASGLYDTWKGTKGVAKDEQDRAL